MIPNLAEDWNRRRASHRFYPAIAFTDEGVVWGAGTVVARMRADPSGVPSLDVERDHDRIIALVAVAARGVPPDLTGHFKSAAAHWRRGNKVQAHFHLAFARLPRLEHVPKKLKTFSIEDML